MIFIASSAFAQQVDENVSAPVLRTQTRLVIEDVIVMDAKGNPVHGLPASAFHILDNDHAQAVRNFSEGSPQLPEQIAPAALPPGTFSNRAAADSAATVEVLLLDADNTPLLDQLFLRKQLQTAIERMPADLPVSVFSVANGRATPLLVASTDRAALQRSVNDAMPVQTVPVESRFNKAVNQLFTVAAYLQQTPGRKNLLWFASNFPLVPVAPGEQQAGGVLVDYTAREHEIHLVQEALAEARISVYPVDPRGVLDTLPADTAGAPATMAAQQHDVRGASAASAKRAVAPPPGANATDERSQMRRLAEATGGRAYFLNNLAEEIGQAFDLGRSAYTLTYTPSPYALDQSWHTVRIEVDGNYQISYRRGYLATFTGEPAEPERTRLTRDGAKRVDPNLHRPIVFQVKITPKDGPWVEVAFSIPMSELFLQHEQGVWKNTLIVTSYAYDAAGKVRDGKVQELDTGLSDEAYARAREANQSVATRQQLRVPSAAKYLVVYVRDPGSQRTGSILLRTGSLAALPAAEPSAAPAGQVSRKGAERPAQ